MKKLNWLESKNPAMLLTLETPLGMCYIAEDGDMFEVFVPCCEIKREEHLDAAKLTVQDLLNRVYFELDKFLGKQQY